MNLIMNAIEAVRSGSNRSGYLQIRSGLSEDGRSVLLAVENSGPGIDKKDMDRIFEPFFTTKSHPNGNRTCNLSVDHRSPWRTFVDVGCDPARLRYSTLPCP